MDARKVAGKGPHLDAEVLNDTTEMGAKTQILSSLYEVAE